MTVLNQWVFYRNIYVKKAQLTEDTGQVNPGEEHFQSKWKSIQNPSLAWLKLNDPKQLPLLPACQQELS